VNNVVGLARSAGTSSDFGFAAIHGASPTRSAKAMSLHNAPVGVVDRPVKELID